MTGATAGSSSISLSGGSINISANCTITVVVTDNTSGAAVNTTGSVSSTNGGTDGTATATLAVEVAPTITKSFAPSSIAVNGTSTMTITIVNPAGNTVPLTGIAVSDTFPTNMKVATPSGAESLVAEAGLSLRRRVFLGQPDQRDDCGRWYMHSHRERDSHSRRVVHEHDRVQ